MAGELLGIDLDNTIIGYDRLMHRIAVEQGVIAPTVPATKRDVCAAVRSTPGGEDRWQRLQGQVYGPRIVDAVPMDGVCTAVGAVVRAGVRVAVVSHKTRVAAQGDGTDLHESARGWLDLHGVFAAGLSPDAVYFAGTAAEPILVSALTAGASDGFSSELLEVQLVEGVKRYWLNSSKRGKIDAPDSIAAELSAEETERARQRNLARQSAAGNA